MIKLKILVIKVGYLSLIFIFTSPVLSQSKQKMIEGIVQDKESKALIPYALVKEIDGQGGSVTNDEGKFKIKISRLNNTVIEVSSLGYITRQVRFDENSDGNLIVELERKSIILDDVSVYAYKNKKLTPEKILRSALKSLNKETKGQTIDGYFYHYIKENGTFTKLINSKIRYEDNGYGKIRKPSLFDEQFTFLEKDESLDFTVDRIDFETGFFDTYFNPAAFLYRNGLKYQMPGTTEYKYAISDTVLHKGRTFYILTAYELDSLSNDRIENKLERHDMNFYVERLPNDYFGFKVVKFEFLYESRNDNILIYHQENSLFTVRFGDEYNSPYPTSFELFLKQDSYWKKRPNEKTVLESESILKISNNESSEFVKLISVEKRISDDLSKRISLAEQFEFSERNELDVLQDSMDRIMIDSLIEKYSGDSMTLVFWDHFDIVQPHWSKLVEGDYPTKPVIYIGNFSSEQSWSHYMSGTEFSYLTHFNLPHSADKLLEEYCGDTVFPRYVSVSSDGGADCSNDFE